MDGLAPKRNIVVRAGFAMCLLVALVSCGGGDAPSSSAAGNTTVAAASNVVSVVVDGGPNTSSPNANTLYTTVTVCVPGSTTECQTIDHIQVDTGSYGLRLLSSVLTVTLPVIAASDGNTLVECTQFVDGYSWGPVSSATVQISGETASSVPVQVIGSPNYASVPADCSSSGPAEDTVATFGANGILGIGVFAQDCGAGCVSNAANGDYYSCPQAGACVMTTAALTSQVQNPVALFVTDNDGTILVLPSVGAAGAATLTGSLIFGIDTQTNNASGTQTVLTVGGSTDPYPSELAIVFNGTTLNQSFIDSGSNAIFFNDSALAQCTNASYSGFYCPSASQTFNVTLQGDNNVSAAASFTVSSAESLLAANPTYTAFSTLAGTYSSSTDTFDWGLPFYFGRRVATAIEGHTTAVNTGPYVAY